MKRKKTLTDVIINQSLEKLKKIISKLFSFCFPSALCMPWLKCSDLPLFEVESFTLGGGGGGVKLEKIGRPVVV